MSLDDIALLLETARDAEDIEPFERVLLDLVEQRIGYDVAFCVRSGQQGAYRPGFDEKVAQDVRHRWKRYGGEFGELLRAALGNDGAVVDREFFGAARLERMSVYDEVMRPHRGRISLIGYAGSLGFSTIEEPSPVRVTGLLLESVACPEPGVEVFFPPSFGCAWLLFPLRDGRARVYFACHSDVSARRYSGFDDVSDLLGQCTAAGLPGDWIATAKPAGPLATFDTTCTAAEYPAKPGVALIGDAAGNADPALGCGLSLAFRDARTLSELLVEHDDWHEALRRYSERRREYYAALTRLESWVRRILYSTGPEADGVRARALPRLIALGVDLVGAGPESPSDEAIESALFGP